MILYTSEEGVPGSTIPPFRRKFTFDSFLWKNLANSDSAILVCGRRGGHLYGKFLKRLVAKPYNSLHTRPSRYVPDLSIGNLWYENNFTLMPGSWQIDVAFCRPNVKIASPLDKAKGEGDSKHLSRGLAILTSWVWSAQMKSRDLTALP